MPSPTLRAPDARPQAPRTTCSWRHVLFVMLVFLVLAPSASAATVVTDADTYVDSATPSANYASAAQLKIYGVNETSPNGAGALLEFPAVRAGALSLRLWSASASPGALKVRAIEQGCGWDYATVNWTTRPSAGTVLGQVADVAAGWNDIPLSVQGTGANLCLYVTRNVTGVVQLDSLSGPNPAQLVVRSRARPTADHGGGGPKTRPSRPSGPSMSPSGSDSNPCTVASPCRSLRRIYQVARPGDTIWVRGGTYNMATSGNDSSYWDGRSGTAGAPITMKAYHGEKPVFDGNWQLGEIWIFNGNDRYIVIDGITFQHFDNSSGNGTITAVGESNHITFQHNTFRENGRDLYRDHAFYFGQGTEHDWVIRHNTFTHQDYGAGVQSYGHGGRAATNVWVSDNRFVDNEWGILLCGGNSNWHITNNTFWKTNPARGTAPSSAALSFDCGDGPNGTTYVYNNVVKSAPSSGTSYAWKVYRPYNPDIHHGYNVLAGPLSGISLGDHETQASPRFVAPPLDLRLQAGSVGVGASTDAP